MKMSDLLFMRFIVKRFSQIGLASDTNDTNHVDFLERIAAATDMLMLQLFNVDSKNMMYDEIVEWCDTELDKLNDL